MRIKLNISCVVVLIAGMVSAPALSLGLAEVSGANRSVPEASQQKWTPVQKEVWRTVQAYSDASHHRDLQKYLSFWHPDFLGWHNGDDHTTDYEQRSGGLEYYFGVTKSLEYELEPMGIQVIGDRAAIVHYKLRNVIQSVESGKVSAGLSYWTDYLTLENGKWLLISDHGGSVSEEATMNQEKRSSNRIDYVEIPVVNVQAAKKFYGDVFGWKFVDYGPDYASFNDGRLDGGIRKDEGGGGRGGPLVLFYDARLEDKEAKIRESGGQVIKEIFEFPGGRRFHFLDPDGNEFAVWSDK